LVSVYFLAQDNGIHLMKTPNHTKHLGKWTTSFLHKIILIKLSESLLISPNHISLKTIYTCSSNETLCSFSIVSQDMTS